MKPVYLIVLAVSAGVFVLAAVYTLTTGGDPARLAAADASQADGSTDAPAPTPTGTADANGPMPTRQRLSDASPSPAPPLRPSVIAPSEAPPTPRPRPRVTIEDIRAAAARARAEVDATAAPETRDDAPAEAPIVEDAAVADAAPSRRSLRDALDADAARAATPATPIRGAPREVTPPTAPTRAGLPAPVAEASPASTPVDSPLLRVETPGRASTRETPIEPTTYTIQSGDTFESIAIALYGDARYWDEIAQANPLVDPTQLRVGQVVRLPDELDDGFDEHQTVAPGEVVRYTVRPGDTLSDIAQQYYGRASRWRYLYNNNRDTIGPNPNTLRAGDVLVVRPYPEPAR